MLQSIEPGQERERYMPLLLLADESEIQVRSYLQEGELYVLSDADGIPLGVVLVLYEEDASAELKAVAVAPEHQGRGRGKHLVALVLATLRANGIHRVVVGTGNSSIGQMAFYQKAGFRLWRIERDAFTAERGYPADLEENGIRLRDMVWLDQRLDDSEDERSDICV